MKKLPLKSLILAGSVFATLVLGAVLHIVPRVRLGWRANLILAGVTHVDAFRVMSHGEADDLAADGHPATFGPSPAQIDDCYVIATAATGGKALANQIGRILLTEATYSSNQVDCITQPGVVFRLSSGSRSLDVILCFHCGEMMTRTHDADGNSVPGVYTLMAGSSYHDFADLAKQAFPDDPDIQKIGGE